MKDIYRKRFVSSARKQKFAIKKLEKKISRTYNIKAFWQYNCDLCLNSKANMLAFELAKSSKSASEKETNFANLLFDVTWEETKTPILS